MNDVDNIACSEAHLSAGLELEKQQQWQEAAVQYQRAIELAPDCARSVSYTHLTLPTILLV